ncbi:FAD-containing monooxygenase EthA [Neonectria ditissima]|uniref:FAD-containing monooxygenase EthA n=1 Tax=Neonectria ditissima TaxID=78410 RepID=A0A0P7BUU5_9HYPO|nr:FAD-containing monooxygenase EthA [Neonectria ditissima]
MDAFDVIIVGAGLAGINAAYRLQTALPHLSYAILEARADLGGTWDLFRYPGIRSDSDLYTYGFAWQPWDQGTALGSGSAIMTYMRNCARSHGIDEHVHYNRRLRTASWSTPEQMWTLTVSGAEKDRQMQYRARFVMVCTGYYDYSQGMQAAIPGLDGFKGLTVHPQFWPEDIDYADKQVVVVGSGATAITLIPELAKKAARTTMVQRSPSYILSIPNGGKTASWPVRLLPARWGHAYTRLSFLVWSRCIWLFCQAFPGLARKRLRKGVEKELPPHMAYDPHFNPRYNPWDQRVCLTPNAEFFRCLHAGKADIRTGVIKEVVADGVVLDNAPGDKIPADIIVTATGLKLQIAGGAAIEVDGVRVRPADKYLWNGAMLQDVPNLSLVIGYSTISWTLGVDTAALLTCRLLRRMAGKKASSATPRAEPGGRLTPRRLFNLTSTFVTTAESELPRAAAEAPWQPRTNYLSDYWFVKLGRLEKGLQFVREKSESEKSL